MRTVRLLLYGALTCLAAPPANATFHLWQIDEVYSNASGTVQFVELTTTAGGQNFLTEASPGFSESAFGHSFNFPADLVGNTANQHFLIATPGYIALSGVPPADFSFGINDFFSTTADTLNYANVNSLTFTAGQLPIDGVMSLNRIFNPPTPTTFTTAVNSPADFAGTTGSIPEPDISSSCLVGAVILLLCRLRSSHPPALARTSALTGQRNSSGSPPRPDLSRMPENVRSMEI
jgi:hypothetical protein